MFFLQRASICIFGFTLSVCPFFLLQKVTHILALVYMRLSPQRQRLIYENIRLSFPAMSNREVHNLQLTSTERTIEQGLLAFAWPFLSKKKITQFFRMKEEAKKFLSIVGNAETGLLFMIPHFCHAEAVSLIPEYCNGKTVFALYRPLRNSVFDRWVRKSRERFGVKTIGRKDGGMLKTLRVLKNNMILSMLFDQNAGGAGTRLVFMGRECSCTTLPDILHKKYNPLVLFVYTKRTGFWQSTIEIEEAGDLDPDQLIIERANDWLEGKLRDDKILRESWLWLHQRWKPGAGNPRKRKLDE